MIQVFPILTITKRIKSFIHFMSIWPNIYPLLFHHITRDRLVMLSRSGSRDPSLLQSVEEQSPNSVVTFPTLSFVIWMYVLPCANGRRL
ncbi:ORF167 [White spot syndrome virus]|uniref:Wsv104 n=5 Tax=White spot syndrome virus TaxID=342409 RepID=Q8VB79_WSSVS|nr:wsv104 [Shrimp white spot syndrome virus]AFX59481.1 wsv104 [White spot syndrome virus]AAL33108.1 wsv104 [Shrimp white spot syndrome virus]AAL89028.1 WSSV160 [Shrimp white spot syndrome virus]ATU83746.1 ORF167 [White spot syndrome virus]AWQ60292.1 wsv104 [Shrimp white spot syndrome virus]